MERRMILQQDTDLSEPSKLEKQIQKLRDDDAAMQSRTWSYYKKIKDEDREKFLSSKIQAEMQAAAQYHGEHFADGDF